MNATIKPTASGRPAARPSPRQADRRQCQLEEAIQLRDLLSLPILIAANALQGSVSLTLDDASALERLLTDSIEQAKAMGAGR